MKKTRQKRRIKVDVTRLLHDFLRAECHCTEKEVEILDAVLQRMVPVDDAEQLMAIFDGKITSERETPRIALDMGRGEVIKFQMNMQHPQMLLLEYLEKRYGHRFGTLYWFAFGSNPKDFYTLLRKIHHAPIFARLFTGDGSEVEA